MKIKPHYGFVHESAFDQLWQYIANLACRDQEEDGDTSPGTRQEMSVRRAEGHALARLMRDKAASMVTSLEAIHTATLAFNNDVVRWNPSLLEEIFDVDVGGPENVFLPDEIEALLTFFSGLDWDLVDEKLTAMAALPVRERLNRGPVANTTLRRAVTACRHYWRDVEERGWSMSMLKNPSTRYENRRENLKGECEMFVALLLEACGLRFSLQELSTAWVKVDAFP